MKNYQLHRLSDQPILQTSDVSPSIEGFDVLGAFNPAACIVGDEVILLLRVAEAPRAEKGFITVPLIDDQDGVPTLTVKHFVEPSEPYDPRVITLEGKVYLTSLSHLRIARSRDGIHFTIDEKPFLFPARMDESYGIEDARITFLEGKYWITYTAVSEHGPGVGLAVTTDFKTVERIGMILPPPNKDVALFRKNKRKYMLLHRPMVSDIGKPSVWLAESEDGIHWGNHHFLFGGRGLTDNSFAWEGAKIGAGPEPILTDEGWLVCYHGADPTHAYSLALALLDKNDPAKVLDRSDAPLLMPELHWEREINLNYFSGDYRQINTASIAFPTFTTPSSSVTTTMGSLYNGNISSMAVNIPKLGAAYLYGYKYDQLNRITSMDAFTGYVGSSNTWTVSATDSYKERISYDANGNILTYNRNGNSQFPHMDKLTYQYPKYANTQANIDAGLVGKIINNRLRYVHDDYITPAMTEDIESQTGLSLSAVNSEILPEQSGDNYKYDEIGNLVKDTKEGINEITWNVYGKIKSITKTSSTGVITIITYSYDASGNRISKTANGKTTVYVRDASGNVMSVYATDAAVNSGDLMQNEIHLYGSSRLGIFNVNRDVQTLNASNYVNNISTFVRGNKFFELSNHLGNVLVTISDKRIQKDDDNNGIVDAYNADVISANDYYPFGMLMQGRKYSADKHYRYGFNGKENDNEVKGEGNQQDYGMRIYDTRLGRFLSVDPLTSKFISLSTYQFSGDSPILFIDLDGDEPKNAPLPGENGLTLHAPRLQGPDAGKLVVWTAVNGQWLSSKLPTPNANVYSGKSTYYDVAEAKYGIPSGSQSTSHNISVPGYSGSYVASPVFNDNKVVSHYVIGEWQNVLDVPGGRNVWVNVCIIRADDMPDWYAHPEKINELAWGNSNSLKTKMMLEEGNTGGALVNIWKENNKDPLTWVNATLIFAGGSLCSPESSFRNIRNAANELNATSTLRESTLRNLVPKGAINEFVPSSTISDGFKYSFETSKGRKIQIKWHSPDGNAAAKFPGSNSGAGWTAQIKIGNKLLGSDGKFYRKPTNVTHIPVIKSP